jgi:hypothetical protein
VVKMKGFYYVGGRCKLYRNCLWMTLSDRRYACKILVELQFHPAFLPASMNICCSGLLLNAVAPSLEPKTI